MWQQCRAINRCCESLSGNISIVLSSAEGTGFDTRYRPPPFLYESIDSFPPLFKVQQFNIKKVH